MSAKKIALDLIINIKKGDITLDELNEQLAHAKQQMEEIGDDGSDEFKALGQVVADAEESMEGFNDELANSKKGLDDTADAQKKAAQGSGVFSKGLKGVGTAFKALGIGLVVAGLKFLFDALSRNQKVMDAVDTVMGAIAIVFNQVVTAVVDVVEQVSKSSKGFEGLKSVMSGLLTLAITPIKLAFYDIRLALQLAQRAWEGSFFGGGDEDKIKELDASIKETSKNIKETADSAVKAGSQIVDNLGKAASEIGQVVTKSVEGISKISIDAAIEQAKTNVALKNSAEVAAASQGLLVEKYDRLAEKQRQIRDDERVSITDRIKANEQLGLELDKQEEAMIAQADLQIKNAQAQKDTNGQIADEVALIQAKANKLAILAQVEGFRSEQKVNAATLDREQITLNNTLSKSEADLAYERAKFNAEQIQDKLTSLQALRDLEEGRQQEEMLRLEGVVEATRSGTQAEIDALIALDEFRETSRQANIAADKGVLEEVSALNKQEIDGAVKNQEQKVELAMQTLGALSNLITSLAAGDEEAQKKAFKLNKAFGIGQAIISTAQGVSNAFVNPVDVASGVAFVKAGIIATSGAAQIATIAKTQFNGGSSSVAPAPTLGSGGGGTQPIGFTPSGTRREQTTSRVIVVETDIRKATRDIDGIYSKAIVVE